MSNSSDEIVPDEKDWTWVLERVCPECNIDVRSFPVETVGELIRENGREWSEMLAHAVSCTERPRPGRWSLLEYSAHVRDVFRLYLFRLDLMLTEEGPSYPNWDQDRTAVAERYNEQDPNVVRVELESAADALAPRFDAVSGDDWSRTGYRSDGAEFTVDTFARYLLHDPVHHLWDVRSN
jgi:hypothetical protein